MKLNKILLATGFGLLMGAGAANAADQGHGKITFTGSVIEAPCSIAPDSLDQTKELGAISRSFLAASGKSTPVNFEVNLQNCDATNLTDGVQITFNGANAGFGSPDEILGVTGTAQGVGIQMTSASGSDLIKLGQPVPYQKIVGEDATLAFSAYVIGDQANPDDIAPGKFSSVVEFTLNYQ